MKKILFILFILFIGFLAADWTPPENINLRNIYEIINATNISAAYFCGTNNSCYTISEISQSGTTYKAGGIYIYLNGSNFFILNETKLNNTIELLDDDTTYSNLSEFIDDLGNRGYTSLSNFSDDIGVSSDWDEIGDVPTATPNNGDTTHLSTADQIYDWVASNPFLWITNAVNDLINYYTKSETYNKTEVYNKTEIDTQGEVEAIWGVTLSTDTERTTGLAAQDECSEITNCVVGALTSESDPFWSDNDSNVARIGDCPSGQFVQNTTIGGVECAEATTTETDPLWSGNKTEVAFLNQTNLGDINVSGNYDFCIVGDKCLSEVGTGGGDITDVFAGIGIIVADSSGPQPNVSINTTYMNNNYVPYSGAVANVNIGSYYYYGTRGYFDWIYADRILARNADNINLAENLVPITDSSYELGNSTHRFSSFWADAITVNHFKIDTTNITCFNSACTWYANATDSCMYWPSGGKDCGAA